MFTGIIETTGIIKDVMTKGANTSFWIQSPISTQLKIDQSLSHDGVCLTVEELSGGLHRVTAIAETLKKTTLSSWQPGKEINLEQALRLGDRLDGHLVQGHVDCKVTCKKIRPKSGSLEMTFRFPSKYNRLIIEKGSVCLNGISLTAFEVKKKSFTVAIIPYTFEHTNLKHLKEGEEVNIEFDLLGKYLLKHAP
jgi:riboflavin synthase